jgi:AraC-like DNA-binding protein
LAKTANLVRAGTLTGYAELARSLGIDPDHLIREVGLHRFNLADADVMIPASMMMELLERSAAVAGVEDFGLRLAATRRLAHLGPVGLIVREEPTARHAIIAAERYFRLYSETLAFRLEEHGDVATLRTQYLVPIAGGARQATELTIGVVFRTINILVGGSWTPENISFTHPPPAGRTMHASFFKTQTLFDNGFDGIIVRSADLSAPIPTADAAMARYVRRYLDTMLAQSAVTIDATVRQLVFALLPSGRCTSEAIAQHLGVDRKTVNRRLAATGETFSSILNDVRVELARRHIKTERRSLTETAELLGFSGLATFSRWFRAEFGTSASDWRKDGAADDHRQRQRA